MYDDPVTGGDRIAFNASDELIEAVDVVCGREGVSRAHVARRILAERLKADGHLRVDAPASKSEARRRSAP